MAELSKEYRSMIYVAIATMYLYSKNIDMSQDMTIEEFKRKNKDLIDRVFEETKNVFNYLLSGEQMDRACYSFMYTQIKPQDPTETEAYTLET